MNINGVALSTDLNSYATSLDFTMDSNSYVISAVLKNGSTNLSSKTIDLPLETMVVDASYDSANKNINLTLKNGTVTSFGIADLVNGLVPDTRTVNEKALSANVVIYGTDIKLTSSAGAVTLTSKIEILEGQIANAGGGDMMAATYVNAGGTGVVLSAGNATTVNGHTVSANVPADAVFTDTIPGTGVLTISGVGSSLGTFNANASSNSTITIPQATSTVYGLAKVEKVVSNTDNAVANSVVSGISATMNSHNTSSALHVPSMATASNGQVLTYDSATASAKWVSLPAGNAGDMTIASFVNGNGVVKSATYATSAIYDGSGNVIANTYQTKIDASHKISGAYISGAVESATSAGNASTVNGFTVGVNVPSTAVFTDTIPGSATITLKANNTNIGSFSVNASENASVDIPAGTNASYGVVKVETTISNTTNAVANSVVFATSSSLASAINAHAGNTNVHVPSTGTTGYFLKKTENGNTWAAVDTPTLTVDSEITSDGVNAVAGSAIYHAVEARAKIEDLSKVAFTGNYSDLIGTPNDTSINAHVINSAIHVPTGGTSGQVLKMTASGVPAWGTDLTVDGSAVLPTYGAGDANKVLKVNNAGTSTSWETANVGDMTIASYVNGNGVVKSATHAASASSLTNAITINGVSLNAGTTKTLAQMNIASATHTHGTGDITSFSEKVSSAASNVASTYVANNVHNATITFTQGGVTKGSFTLNQNTASTIALDAGGGEITVDGAITSNGTNAVAGSAIYSALETQADIEDFAQVAFTGDYDDLTNTPSIDSVVVQSGVNAVTGSAVYAHVASAIQNAGSGDMAKSVYDTNDDGVVNSAANATTAGSAASAGSAVSASKLTTGITINGMTLNGGSSVTLANLNIASATHTHTSGDITSFNEKVSSIASTVASAQVVTVKVSGSTISSMVAGTNVTLTRNGGVVTIDATGGGNITVDGTVTQNGTNAVAGSAVYNYVDAQIGNIETLLANI